MKTIAKSKFWELKWDASLRLAYCRILRSPESESLRTLIEVMTIFIEQKSEDHGKPVYSVFDAGAIQWMSFELLMEYVLEAMPAWVSAGLHFQGVIKPKSFVSLTEVNSIVCRFEGLPFILFDSKPEALAAVQLSLSSRVVANSLS